MSDDNPLARSKPSLDIGYFTGRRRAGQCSGSGRLAAGRQDGTHELLRYGR